MNKCRCCGKEIDSRHTFCNSSCAAKYNNAYRIRKPWTEEQRKRFSEKMKGKRPHSEKVQKKSKEKLPGYYRRCTKALGVDLKNLGETLENLYWREGVSIVEFWNRYKIPYWVLHKLFKTYKIRFRTDAESQIEALSRGRRHLQTSHLKYKFGYHTTWEGKEIYYRSSYELEYAQQLDKQKVRYEVESKRIRYFDRKQQRERVAIPDFYLPDTNELVEIKSTWTYDEQNMRDKFKAYRDSGYSPILVLDKKQIEL